MSFQMACCVHKYYWCPYSTRDMSSFIHSCRHPSFLQITSHVHYILLTITYKCTCMYTIAALVLVSLAKSKQLSTTTTTKTKTTTRHLVYIHIPEAVLQESSSFLHTSLHKTSVFDWWGHIQQCWHIQCTYNITASCVYIRMLCVCMNKHVC